MRKQIIAHYEGARGEGLSDVARAAVALLAAQAREQGSAPSIQLPTAKA